MKEKWRSITGYESLYMISNFGNVYSLRRKRAMKKYIDKAGYCRTGLTKEYKTKQIFIHRLVSEMFISNPKNKPHINHKDFNRSNNYSNNLEWVTRKENMAYSKLNGRFAMSEQRKTDQKIINSGENNPRTKILNKNIPEIIELKKRGLYDREIADMYGVGRRVINNIINNKTFQTIKQTL